MVVYVLMVIVYANSDGGLSVSSYHIDNIENAKSCEQLAKVARNLNPGKVVAVCAPVRKVQS